jgi:hypothetical protein
MIQAPVKSKGHEFWRGVSLRYEAFLPHGECCHGLGPGGGDSLVEDGDLMCLRMIKNIKRQRKKKGKGQEIEQFCERCLIHVFEKTKFGLNPCSSIIISSLLMFLVHCHHFHSFQFFF